LGTTIAPGLLDELGDRGGVVQRGLGLLRVGRADDAEPHLHGQLAVALLVDDPLEADGATGPREVEYLHRAGDALLLHDLGRGAGGRVVTATRGVRNHVLQAGGGGCTAGRCRGRVAGTLVLGRPAAGDGEGGREDGAEGDVVESHR
jgi:hypothetical protein